MLNRNKKRKIISNVMTVAIINTVIMIMIMITIIILVIVIIVEITVMK